jgi:hypothetical protein
VQLKSTQAPEALRTLQLLNTANPNPLVHNTSTQNNVQRKHSQTNDGDLYRLQ